MFISSKVEKYVFHPKKFLQIHQNIFCSVLTNEHFGVLDLKFWSGINFYYVPSED